MIPVVLTISGSDSSAGAGIQADLNAIRLNGGFGVSAVTAVTVQNSQGVRSIEPVSDSLLGNQIKAIFDDFEVSAVKIGMLPNTSQVEVVVRSLSQFKSQCPIVIDPVQKASDGSELSNVTISDDVRKSLYSQSTLVTPNSIEASQFSGLKIDAGEDSKSAATCLSQLWGTSVLVKGGHLQNQRGTDVLFHERELHVFSSSEVLTNSVHGTGCMMASAIATQLALKKSLLEAVEVARSFIKDAIKSGVQFGSGQKLSTLGVNSDS